MIDNGMQQNDPQPTFEISENIVTTWPQLERVLMVYWGDPEWPSYSQWMVPNSWPSADLDR